MQGNFFITSLRICIPKMSGTDLSKCAWNMRGSKKPRHFWQRALSWLLTQSIYRFGLVYGALAFKPIYFHDVRHFSSCLDIPSCVSMRHALPRCVSESLSYGFHLVCPILWDGPPLYLVRMLPTPRTSHNAKWKRGRSNSLSSLLQNHHWDERAQQPRGGTR